MTDQLDQLRSALSGSYAVEREIGRGGMATVYLATDLKHERQVAIKVLRSELAAAVGHDRFLLEIKTTAQLTNPHILPLLDSGDAGGALSNIIIPLHPLLSRPSRDYARHVYSTRSEGRRMSLDEYLVFEESSSVKHEFVAGEVCAMSGVTFRHGRIALNVAAHLRDAARARACAIVLSEVKLRAAVDRIYYPDVMLACGKAAEVELIVEEPSLLVEVTSANTRATDRREKLDAYLRIPSLRTYLVIDQRRRHVLCYTRDAHGEWLREEIQGDGDIAIPFLDAHLTLEEIYEDVTLPPLTVKEGEEWDE